MSMYIPSNMNSNSTSGCDFELLKGLHFESIIFVYSIIVSLESTLVVVIIYRIKALHTTSDTIVASLSLTDVVLCAAYTAHGVKTLVGYALSKPQKNLLVVFLFGDCYGGVLISISHLGFAAIDRYIQIVHPFYHMKHMTKRRVFIILVIIWLTGAMYTMTPLLAYTDDKYNEECIILHPPLEYFCILFIGYLANVMIVFISYLKIARVAFHHKKSANIRRLQNEGRTNTNVFSQNRKAALKSVKFFVVMFGAFLLFTSPCIVVTGLNVVFHIPSYMYLLTLGTLTLNSFTNCLIYAFLRKDFLKALMKTVRNIRQRVCNRPQFTNNT